MVSNNRSAVCSATQCGVARWRRSPGSLASLTGTRPILIRTRFIRLLRATKPLSLVVVVIAWAGVVLAIVFAGGLVRLLGAVVRLRTFPLLWWRRPHHGLDVAAEWVILLLLLHEGDAHGRSVRHCGLVLLLLPQRRHRVRRRVLGRCRREGEERMRVRMLGGGEGLVCGGGILLEAAAPRTATQCFGLEPGGVQARVEVRSTHLPTAKPCRWTTCRQYKTLLSTYFMTWVSYFTL